MKPADREALRQQTLLRALLGDAPPAALAGWLRGDATRATLGLAAYRANAGALAERALAAAFPTLQQLLGAASFAGLARAFWQRHPPVAGDIAQWGGLLPAFVADAESLAAEPYLADIARLEWAVHQAERAEDAPPPSGLDLLADGDPAQLLLELAPGTALLVSAYPVASIWHAHRGSADDRFAAARAALDAGRGEQALVQRSGWHAGVTAVPVPVADFTAAVLAGSTLAQALHAGGAAFNFEAWLIGALQQQTLARVRTAEQHA